MGPVARAHVEAHRKSGALALMLAFLFGPLGTLYANRVVGAILIIGMLAVAALNPLVAALLGWLVAMMAAPIAVASHNEALRERARLHYD